MKGRKIHNNCVEIHVEVVSLTAGENKMEEENEKSGHPPNKFM
jgi:hypothetical protein